MSDGLTTVYYDGGCPVCLRGKRHFAGLDWAGRLAWVDLIEHPDVLAGFGVDFAAAMEHMHVVDRDGRLHAGGHAFLALCSELPGYRHLAAALRATGLDGLVDSVYRRLVRGRYLRRCQAGLCATPDDEFESLGVSFGAQLVAPAQRRQRVRAMFERIAPRYDLMNDLMSFGIHRLWKRQALWGVDPRPGQLVVDLAGGTGDMARRLAARGCTVLVCDPVLGMMRCGRSSASPAIGWIAAVGESLPLCDASVDAVVMAFGLRNMTSPLAALAEIRRVLRPGGRLVCLEFSRPHPVVAPFYAVFSRAVIPALGSVIAGDTQAYRYLIESIRRFPSQDAVAARMREAGFDEVRYRNVSFGIGCIHLASSGPAAGEATHAVTRSSGAAARRTPGRHPAPAAAARSVRAPR